MKKNKIYKKERIERYGTSLDPYLSMEYRWGSYVIVFNSQGTLVSLCYLETKCEAEKVFNKLYELFTKYDRRVNENKEVVK